MIHSLEKDFKKIIKKGDCVEVSIYVMPYREVANFARREKFWIFENVNSTIIWNGNGIDPRKRK